jgi:hypothetical protein
LKSSEVTLKKKQLDAEAEAKIKVERAIKRHEKQKAKIIKHDPMPEITEDNPVEADVPEPVEEHIEERPPSPEPVKRVVRKKKPVVIVQDDSESELESDDPQVIVVKRKAKPKEPVPDPRFKPQPNPFGRNYFYSPTAMS